MWTAPMIFSIVGVINLPAVAVATTRHDAAWQLDHLAAAAYEMKNGWALKRANLSSLWSARVFCRGLWEAAMLDSRTVANIARESYFIV